MTANSTQTDRFVSLKPLEDVSEAYFGSTALAHSVFRTVELRHVCESALERPVLDVGCGTGQFASIAMKSPIDVGLDFEGYEPEPTEDPENPEE